MTKLQPQASFYTYTVIIVIAPRPDHFILPRAGQIMGSRRTRQACVICRDRKVKCDRAQPNCGRCIRLNEPCSYDTFPAGANLSRQVQDLQARLGMYDVKSADGTKTKALQKELKLNWAREGTTLRTQVQVPDCLY